MLSAAFPDHALDPWTEIAVDRVELIGSQKSPNVTEVSRDGGISGLIGSQIIWIFDDTECLGFDGDQLSFVSNTAATSDPNANISAMQDYGVQMVGKDKRGREQYAILADSVVGTGGWIPFNQEEVDFNQRKQGSKRIALWPGASMTPVELSRAIMYVPIMEVDFKPREPAEKFKPQGATLITIEMAESVPRAVRHGDAIDSNSEFAYGTFACLLGMPPADSKGRVDERRRNVYLFGPAKSGLQLATVDLRDARDSTKFTFYDPGRRSFSDQMPDGRTSDPAQVYLPGTFATGNVFFSPYFKTFLLVYFNKMADSTFYIRFLDLNQPVDGDHGVWAKGGKDRQGISAEDAEALVKYAWSPDETLYVTPHGKSFNYAGNAHPQYFNRRFFPQSLYPEDAPPEDRRNEWYGSTVIDEGSAGSDGKYLLLSWTSRLDMKSNAGAYEVCLAVVKFGDLTRTLPEKSSPYPGFGSPSWLSLASDRTIGPCSMPQLWYLASIWLLVLLSDLLETSL